MSEEMTLVNDELSLTNERLEQAYAKLLETELKLILAIGSAQLGLWSLDFEDNSLELKAEYSSMFGFPQNEEISLDQIMQLVEPE